MGYRHVAFPVHGPAFIPTAPHLLTRIYGYRSSPYLPAPGVFRRYRPYYQYQRTGNILFASIYQYHFLPAPTPVPTGNILFASTYQYLLYWHPRRRSLIPTPGGTDFYPYLALHGVLKVSPLPGKGKDFQYILKGGYSFFGFFAAAAGLPGSAQGVQAAQGNPGIDPRTPGWGFKYINAQFFSC